MCTTAGATGRAARNQNPIIGSNSDDPFSTRTRLAVVQPQGGYRFIGTQIISPGQVTVDFHRMFTRGLNEKGFAYTWSAVMPQAEPTPSEAFGIPYYQFGTLLLSQAATVAEAIDLLTGQPRAIAGNFLMVDAGGELALVEVSTRSIHVQTRTRDGWVGRSNHWVSEGMAPLGYPQTAEGSSPRRLERIESLVAEGARDGAVDQPFLAGCFADHEGREGGCSICAHGLVAYPGRTERGGTVSSEIMEPRKGLFWYNYGWPCGGAPELPDLQVHQDRSWGAYLPFRLADMETGEYVTTDGRLTPLAVRYLSGSRAAAPTVEAAD